MGYSLKERFELFICRVFGCRLDKNNSWEYGGKIHAHCKRCRRIKSEPIKD